jgi:hypothetical protein
MFELDSLQIAKGGKPYSYGSQHVECLLGTRVSMICVAELMDGRMNILVLCLAFFADNRPNYDP